MNFKRRKELTEKIGLNRDKMIYIKIFEILNDNHSNYSYNKNGIFFDLGLNKMNEDTIDKLENFIYSIDYQDSKIDEIEKDREMFLDKMKRELKKEEPLSIKHPTLYDEEDEIDYENTINKNSDLISKKDPKSKLPKNWENLNKIMKVNKKKRIKDPKKVMRYIETELNEDIVEESSDIEETLEHNSFSDTEDQEELEANEDQEDQEELEELEVNEDQEDLECLEVQEEQEDQEVEEPENKEKSNINYEIILEQDFIE